MGRMPYVFGASLPVTTHTTPSRARARLVSIFLMRACGYGECRILPISMPGTERSSVYLLAPVVLPAASTMATRLPMMEKSFCISSQDSGVSCWPTNLRARYSVLDTRHCFPLRIDGGADGLVHLRIAGAA